MILAFSSAGKIISFSALEFPARVVKLFSSELNIQAFSSLKLPRGKFLIIPRGEESRIVKTVSIRSSQHTKQDVSDRKFPALVLSALEIPALGFSALKIPALGFPALG